jgi:hypothetical protein
MPPVSMRTRIALVGLDGRCSMKIEVKKLEQVIATSRKPS